MLDAIRSRQFAIFVIGGLICTGVDLGVMQLLMTSGVHHTVAVSVGFCAALVVNYAFHSKVTFARSASGSGSSTFARYLAVIGINYLITIACVTLAVALADNPLAGKLVSLPIVAINGFLLSRYWIFK